MLNNLSNYTSFKSKKSPFVEQVKKNYRSRHGSSPFNKKFSPASLSWYLLWNKTTLGASIKDYEKRFNVNIINKT